MAGIASGTQIGGGVSQTVNSGGGTFGTLISEGGNQSVGAGGVANGTVATDHATGTAITYSAVTSSHAELAGGYS